MDCEPSTRQVNDTFCQSCAGQEWKPTESPRRISSSESLEATYIFEVAFDLGTVASLHRNRTCPRCRFVWRALLERCDVPFDGSGPIIRGYESQFKHVGVCQATDRVTVVFEYKRGPDETWPAMLIVALDGPAGQSSFSVNWKFEVLDSSTLGIQDPAYGRSTHAKVVNIESCQTWLRKCESEHEKCRNRIHQSQKVSTASASRHDIDEQSLDLQFVDVKLRRLVRPRKAVRYVTLSYVWGPGPHDYVSLQDLSTDDLSCEDENVVVVPRQPVGLIHSTLPHTLSDAIIFTEALGERYVWIDALCIPQDDADIELKLAQIEAMDEVFQGAVCTLIALEGTSSTSGLPGSSTNSPRDASPNVETLAPGVRIRMSEEHEDLLHKASTSAWATRAWTLQEGICSFRCLMFTAEQVYFNCIEASASEASGEFTSIEMNAIPFASNNDLLTNNFAIESPDFSYFYQVYARLVMWYTSRSMTYADDALAAMKGIFKVITESQGALFFQGLPLPYFGLALLWEESTDSALVGNPSGWEQMVWPTWTWVGHWSPVEYRNWEAEEDKMPKVIDGAEFAIVGNNFVEALETFVRNRYNHSGRRGISHTKLGTIHLRITAISIHIILKCWRAVKGQDRIYTKRWGQDFLAFDSRHRGKPLLQSSIGKELYLVATWTPTQHYGANYRDGTTKYSTLLKVLVIEVRDACSRRVGIGYVNRDKFARKAKLKEFLME